MGNFTIRVGPASDYCSTWFFAFIHTFARIAVLVPQSDYFFFITLRSPEWKAQFNIDVCHRAQIIPLAMSEQ